MGIGKGGSLRAQIMAEVTRHVEAFESSISITNKKNEQLIGQLKGRINATENKLETWKEYQAQNSKKIASWEATLQAHREDLERLVLKWEHELTGKIHV